MSKIYFNLGGGNLSQNWSNTGLITGSDDWSNVPSFEGFLGQDITTATGTNPGTLLTDSTVAGDLDLNPNQTSPNTVSTGGVAEFEIGDPTIALNGSGTADAPHLVMYLNATGRQNLVVSFNARDLDGSTDNAVQPIAVQYRVGETGAWTNLPPSGGAATDPQIADATTGPSLATLVTPITVTLPSAVNNQAQVQVRFITANAAGNDEWVGIDNIGVTSDPAPQAVRFADNSLLVAKSEGDAGTTAFTFTVERVGSTDGNADFTVELTSTAAGSDDFVGSPVLPHTINGTILGGQATATVTVNVNGDTSVEVNENFALTLTSVTNTTAPAAIDTNQDVATGRILTDDFAGTDVGGVAVLAEAASLQGAAAVPVATNGVELVRLGSYAASGGNAEVVSFDPSTDRLYILNATGNKIEIVQIASTGALSKTGEIDLASLTEFDGANSVAIKNGIVAVAYGNTTVGDNGFVALFNAAGVLQGSPIEVGVLPDMVTFTPDGSKILVANEAEAVSTSSNANGTISVIDVSGGAASATVQTTVGFTALNGSEAALDGALGLSLFPGQSAAADIEPEYIAVSPDGTRAYVTLQEVNAVAVIDLTNPAATSPLAILPLGSVDRSLAGNAFDPSDQDGIDIGTWSNVRSLLQPDAIATFTVGGETYFVTANEGDARVGTGLTGEEVRLGNASYDLDNTVFPNEATLKQNANLGRLNVINHEGDTDGDGDIDVITTFGGRGISIFKQNADGSIEKVRETGGEFERILGQQPNANFFFNGENAFGTFDSRSDNKGPEPEGVDVGVINGRTYAFVVLERAGGVMIYDVTNPANASFVGYKPPLPPTAQPSPDNAPETVKFISAADSPTGTALIVTANEVGNATTVYAAVTPIYQIQGSGHTSSFNAAEPAGSGVVYAFIDNPFIGDDTNGGEPGGNIRTAFLYRGDRVDFVENSLRTIGVNGVSIDTPGSAAALDQQTNVDNPFFGSRPPLVATFEFNGNEVTVVNNHFTSKGGSGAVMGSIEPPLNASEVQRAAQAQAVNNFVDNLLASDANAKVMVAGDLNEFPWEEPMSVLKGIATITGYDAPASGPFDATATYVPGGTAILHDLQDTLPANEQYDYVFDGSAQTLDHMMVTGSLAASAQFDVVRINAEFSDQTSDHDPLVAAFDLPPPTTNYTLQLLHLSDGEAGLLAPQTAPNLAALVDAFDDDYANTLILAGGDDFLAGPFLAGGTDLSVTATLNAVTGSTIGATTNIPIGAVDIAILNSIGVEASTIGNHEFDLGSRVLRDAFSPNLGAAGWVGAQFPYLSANLDFSGDADLNPRFTNTLDGGTGTLVPEASTLKGRIAPSAVITKGGEKIGLVAATTQLIESISSPTGTEVKGFPTGPGANGEVDDMTLLAAQLQPIINELIAEGVNKIILQSHLQQIQNEQLLATKLTGVDIILSAGSNTRLADADDDLVAFPGHEATADGPYPIVTQGLDGKTTLIVNTDGEYTYLGRLVVEFDANGEIVLNSVTANQAINGAYASTEQNVAEAWGTTVANLATTAFADGTKGDKVEKLTDAVEAVINIKDGNVFGYTDVYLEGERGIIRNEETNLGDLSADANAYVARQALGDAPFLVSLKNGGGIRAQIGTVSPPDPVTGEIDKLPPGANPAAGKPEGGVSQLDVENSLRFDNKLMMYDTTPQGLLNILNWGAGLSANNGGFPQIGGVKYSFDPDLPGNSGSTPGSRIRDVALIDQDGKVVALVAHDGVVVADAPALIQVVTLNFTANGGDGYPVKANGDNFRYLLTDGTLSAPVNEALDFTATANVPAKSFGEQRAFGDYMDAFHGTPATAYDQADTPQALDTRIQNLNARDDTVFSSPAIAGTSGSDVLTGTVGKDSIDGLAGNDFLFGNALGDVLNGGTGIDLMFGGAGDDTYFVDGGDGVFENANEGTDTVFSNVHLALATNVENLILQGSADLQGYGNSFANRLDGNTGNNLLNGDTGADVMVGGAGSDAYFVENVGDQVIESAGEGNDAVFSTADFTLSANVEILVLQGAANLQGHGNNLANALYGNTGNNLLDGDTGADVMFGGAGDDTYFFDGSDGVVENANEGIDTVLSTTHYALSPNVETLVLQGSADLQGYGNNLANRLDGNTGNNLLNGGVGADVMVGGAGSDAYFVDDPGDTVVENAGEGTDAVFSTVNYVLAANVETLVLQGLSNLTATGNALGNQIFGNSGDNTLDGGAGTDVLTGGAGNDTLVFHMGQGNGDIVVDFAGNGAGAGDSLQFVGYGPGATFTNVDATHWRVNFNAGSQEVITFMNGAAIDASDFLFA